MSCYMITLFFYFQVLSRHFLRAMRRKRPGKLENFILHHDNAPPHTSKETTTHIDHLSINLLRHPPYSPDLSPNDFYLFPTLKRKLRGVKLNSFSELRTKVLNILKSIPQDDYRHSLLNWVSRWQKCINVDGEYFEKM